MTMKTRIEIDAGRSLFSGLLPELIAALRRAAWRLARRHRPREISALISRPGAALLRNMLINTTIDADRTRWVI
jgi:hypothetical protein